MKKRIYCDTNGSTPIDPRVLKIYTEALQTGWANASSQHHEGQIARSMLAEARDMCANLFHVLPRQIIFYSSATEALNSLVFSLFKKSSMPIITSAVEHSALLEPLVHLANFGTKVDVLSVKEEGALQLAQFSSRDIGGIATSLANTETGSIVDFEAISSFAHGRSIPLLLDGVAALGKMDFSWLPGMTALTFASHKIYAPKGVGMAIVSKDALIDPLLRGGGQEGGRRAGTENVPAIYAFSHALRLLMEEQGSFIPKVAALRDRFEEEMGSSLPNIMVNCKKNRVSSVSNLYIEGVMGEELMMVLDQDGVSISVGAACASGAMEPSKVISSIYSKKRALSSVRISFSRFTTEEDVQELIFRMKKAILQLR